MLGLVHGVDRRKKQVFLKKPAGLPLIVCELRLILLEASAILVARGVRACSANATPATLFDSSLHLPAAAPQCQRIIQKLAADRPLLFLMGVESLDHTYILAGSEFFEGLLTRSVDSTLPWALVVVARVISCPCDVQRTQACWAGAVERDVAVDRRGCIGLFRQSAA